ETTTLLLLCRDMPPDHALAAVAKKAGGEVRVFSTPKRADLPRWAAARSRKAGVVMDRQAADLLIELAGQNVLQLQSEIDKLVTYAGERQEITPSMVETLVGAVTQESVFALVDAIAVGDRAKALDLMRSQMETAGTPM